MPDERTTQTCGNCGHENDAAAIVCASCGVVMAAYAAPAVPHAPTTELPVPDISEVEAPVIPEVKQPPPPAQTPDWRDLFARPVSPTPELEAPPPPPPPKPRSPRNRPAPEPPPAVEERGLAASVAAMRRRASRLPAAAAPRIPQKVEAPRVPNPAPVTTAAVARLPKLVLAGVAVMVVSCILFGITATFSSAEGAPGFAIFCLFPIGVIMLVMGLSSRLAKKQKDDQQR